MRWRGEGILLIKWNNIPVVRSRAKRSNKPATSSQQAQQGKMDIRGWYGIEPPTQGFSVLWAGGTKSVTEKESIILLYEKN